MLIQPMAVCIESKSHAPPATYALSPPPGVPRSHYSLRSRDGEVDKAEAPVQDDPFQMYDVVVPIVMPHPHAADSWGEQGEYAIGITKLVSSVSRDDFIAS